MTTKHVAFEITFQHLDTQSIFFVSKHPKAVVRDQN